MKKIAFILFVGLVFLACNNNEIKVPEKPDNLLSTTKMADILYDMALVNAAKGVNKNIIQNKGLNPQEYIFSNHNIDSLQFANSNNYYTYFPVTYEEIYQKVRIKLENKKKSNQAILDIEKKKRDSIAKLKKKERDSISKVSKKKSDSLKNTLRMTGLKSKKPKSKEN